MCYQLIFFGATLLLVVLFLSLLVTAIFFISGFALSKKFRNELYKEFGKCGRFTVPGIETQKIDVSAPWETVSHQKRRVK